MVKVSVGDVLNLADARYGTRAKDGGKWGFCNVKAETGYDKIQVWFQNPEVAEGKQAVEVVAIMGVKLSNRKYKGKDGQDKWGVDYSVEVTVQPTGADNAYSQNSAPNFSQYMGEFVDLEKVEDPNLPFA